MTGSSSMGTDRRTFIAAAGTVIAGVATPGTSAASRPEPAFGPGRDQPLMTGWRFHRGEGVGFEAPGFDDSSWRAVDLPHDWSIEDIPDSTTAKKFGPFDASAVGGAASGYTVGGEGWYRKRFRIGPGVTPGRVELCFDGVSTVSEVWLNGVLLGTHYHAFTPFSYDLTPHLAVGDNLIAVRARNQGKTCRWYAGSGLYRDVWLDVLVGSARVGRWGVAASTRTIGDDVAEIDVETQCEGDVAGVELRSRLRAPGGAVVAEARTAADATVRQKLTPRNPRLWSPDDPNLYTLETELVAQGRSLDLVKQTFGIRVVAIDAKAGLTINGKRFLMRGGAVHHDNGLLGACAYSNADERRVRLLKARGFTAIRASHNPTSRSFRAACDRQGMMLIEEAFDTWHVAKIPDDYHLYFRDHWREDLHAMIGSARNSPSVVFWSIGNEIPERTSPEGLRWSWTLANEVHRLDPTRPVTAAINEFPGRPVVAGPATARAGEAGKPSPAATMFLDVVGYNYKLGDIERDHAIYPDRVFYASETFAKDTLDYVRLTERAPYFLGDFVWSAIDYIGEAGVGTTKLVPAGSPTSMFFPTSFPLFVSNSGDLDLIGNQRAQSRARDVFWGVSKLEVAIQRPIPDGKVERMNPWGYSDELHCWTWPDAVGHPLAVRIYCAGDRVEVRLNGKLVGDQSVGERMMVEIPIAYAPGVLEVTAYRSGVVVARQQVRTVGHPSALRIAASSKRVSRARETVTFLPIEVVDRDGELVRNLEAPVRISLSGPAQLVGFGSGNKNAVGSFQSPEARTFDGRALAIVRSTGDVGTIRAEVRSDGLLGASVTLRAS